MKKKLLKLEVLYVSKTIKFKTPELIKGLIKLKFLYVSKTIKFKNNYFNLKFFSSIEKKF